MQTIYVPVRPVGFGRLARAIGICTQFVTVTGDITAYWSQVSTRYFGDLLHDHVVAVVKSVHIVLYVTTGVNSSVLQVASCLGIMT